MEVKVEVTGDIERKLSIELPPEDVQKEFDRVYKHYRKSLQIPGFRKGKIPIEIIKARYGEEIKGEILGDLISKAWSEALDEEDLEVISDPEIGDVDYTEGEALRFTVSVVVMPEIKKYEGLKLIKTVYEITDRDVDAYIESLREKNSEEISVERGIQSGDIVIADLREMDMAGVPIIGSEIESEEIIVGGGEGFGAEFGEQLIGAKKDEERMVRFVPGDSRSEETRPTVLSVKVKEIKEKRVPELNEDFARDLGNFASVEELNEKVRENLRREAERFSEKELQNEVMNQLIGENPFDVPEMLVEKVTDDILRNMKAKASTSYVDEEAVRMQARKDAIRDIKSYLIIRGMAEFEGLSVSDEELENHVSNVALTIGADPKHFRNTMQETGDIDRMRSKLLEDKVIDLVVSKAKIEESKANRDAPIYIPGSRKRSF